MAYKQAQWLQSGLAGGGILIFLWLAGCAGPPAGPRMTDVYRGLAPVPESKARVLFIRSDEKTTGWNLKVRFYVDETRVVELPIGACHYMDLKPGRHTVALDAWSLSGSHKLKVDFEAGSQRYLTTQFRKASERAGLFGGVIGVAVEKATAEDTNNGSYEMIELTKEQAVPLLARCVYVDAFAP